MTTGRRTRIAPATALGVALAALLGACGGQGSTSLSAGDATATGGAGSVAAAVAQRVVLGGSDLPGYEADPPATIDATATKAASSFQACAGAASALGDADRSAVSPGFYKGVGTLVTSLAVVSPDQAAAERAMAELSREDVATCLTTLFKDALALDQLPGTTARTERLAAAEVSDDSITWRTTIEVTSKQASGVVYSDLTLFRSGRTVAALFNVQAATPFPSAERKRLLEAMIERTA
ncbi:MAG: hypothetical protein ACRD2W_07280 [Acidimicrobiales bacterium]